jgi:hypothetical protein
MKAMSSNLTCDEILKLIRASKSYNLDYIKCGDLVISRKGDELKNDIQPLAVVEDDKPSEAVLQEMEEYEKENLLISDPEAYEKQVGM